MTAQVYWQNTSDWISVDAKHNKHPMVLQQIPRIWGSMESSLFLKVKSHQVDWREVSTAIVWIFLLLEFTYFHWVLICTRNSEIVKNSLFCSRACPWKKVSSSFTRKNLKTKRQYRWRRQFSNTNFITFHNKYLRKLFHGRCEDDFKLTLFWSFDGLNNFLDRRECFQALLLILRTIIFPFLISIHLSSPIILQISVLPVELLLAIVWTFEF